MAPQMAARDTARTNALDTVMHRSLRDDFMSVPGFCNEEKRREDTGLHDTSAIPFPSARLTRHRWQLCLPVCRHP